MDEELPLLNEQGKQPLEMESTPAEDAVNIVKTTKDLESYINLVDKAVQSLRGLSLTFKEVLLWVKCCQTARHTTEKSFVKEEPINAANFTVVLF